MKRFTKICLILAAVFMVCGLGAAAAGYMGGAFRDIEKTSHTASGKKEVLDVPAKGLTQLNVDLSSEDVLLVPSTDGDLHIEYIPSPNREYEYGKDPAGEDAYYFSSSSEFGLGWRNLLQLHFSWDDDSVPVTVYLPENFSVTLETASGDVEARGISASTLQISTTSGEIDLSPADAEGLYLSTVSGDMEVTGGTVAQDAAFSSTSGDMELSDFSVAGSFSCTSTSGEIDVTSVTVESESPDAAYLSAISGDITLESAVIRGGLSLSTTSGEISLEPATVFGDITAESTSGDVHLNLTGAPPHRSSISTTSGDTHVSGCNDSAEHVVSVSTTSGEIDIRD